MPLEGHYDIVEDDVKKIDERRSVHSGNRSWLPCVHFPWLAVTVMWSGEHPQVGVFAGGQRILHCLKKRSIHAFGHDTHSAIRSEDPEVLGFPP